jgi:hypothetical protein
MDDQQLIEQLDALSSFYQDGTSNFFSLHKKNPNQYKKYYTQMKKLQRQGWDMAPEAIGKFTSGTGYSKQFTTDKGNTAIIRIPKGSVIPKDYRVHERFFKPTDEEALIKKKKNNYNRGGIVKKVYNNTSRKAKY